MMISYSIVIAVIAARFLVLKTLWKEDNKSWLHMNPFSTFFVSHVVIIVDFDVADKKGPRGL